MTSPADRTRHTLTGRCLCQTVRYRIESRVQTFYYCECRQCRRTTGSITATNLCLAPAPIDWLSGDEQVRLRRDPDGRDFSRAFCYACGAALPHLNRAGDTLVVPAGSLDGPPPLSVGKRLFTAERPGWAAYGADLPAYPGFAGPSQP